MCDTKCFYLTMHKMHQSSSQTSNYTMSNVSPSTINAVISSYTPGHHIGNNIILGSLLAFRYPDFFSHCNIKYIFSVKPIPRDVQQVLTSRGINCCYHDIPHRMFADEFQSLLAQALEIVKLAQTQNCMVFINCRSGQHRSVAICCALLMILDGMNYWDAFHHIKSIRACANPEYPVHILDSIDTSHGLLPTDLYVE